MEHELASAKLTCAAQKAVKDQHYPEEANGRLAAESEEPLLPRFFDRQDTNQGYILQKLLDPAGPADFHLLNARVFPRPKCTRGSLEDASPTAVVTSFHRGWKFAVE